MHRFELRVRYGDTDQMGWAYYGNYLRWFEIGRAEMMRSTGRTYRSLEEDENILMPVLDARCRYFHGARYDEKVTIETGVLARARATLAFGYRIVGEDGTRCAIGYTEHCFTNREAKLVRPPGSLVRMFEGVPAVEPALAAELAFRS
jgi:acyl-CoA thioester hydrolase